MEKKSFQLNMCCVIECKKLLMMRERWEGGLIWLAMGFAIKGGNIGMKEFDFF